MKIQLLAVGILIGVLAFTVFDTLFLQKQISELQRDALSLDVSEKNGDAYREAIALRDAFSRAESFISLSVNHEDLTNIEIAFSDLIGALSIDDRDEAEMAKSRLADALTHLRRLSGFHIDAIV